MFSWALLSFGLTTCDQQVKPSAGVTSDDSLVTLAAVVSQKVVNIEAVGASGAGAKTGSGFFVSENGNVVTCAHVIDGAKSIRVKTLSGAEFTFKNVVAVDTEADLAILAVATDGVAFFEKPGVEVSVGTKIAVFGNPLGLKGSLTDGVVSAIRGAAEETRFLQISAPISPGSSGSPVVSLKGELVGMVGARAEGGEGIGFALASKEIWELLGQAVANRKNQEPFRVALEMSRKRYLPSSEVWEDPEWKNGQLPEATPQRLAVLRRLSSKYPHVAVIRVEIAKALRDDGEYEMAFQQCAALIREDPGNRLAVGELIGMPTKEADKVPLVKAAVSADPLNFRARQYLFEQEGSNDDFLSAQLSAQSVLETAPFSLRCSEGYAEALLDNELHELAVAGRGFESFQGERILQAINDSNQLRRVVAAAASVFAEPSEQGITAFIDLAEEKPARALPYAWELAQLGNQGKEEMKTSLRGAAGDRLRSFVQRTIKTEPLIAEAYLLDPGAVDVRDGLLVDAIGNGYSHLWSSFGVKMPFDQVGMLFLLADEKSNADSEPAVQRPEEIMRWIETLNTFTETAKELGGITPRISNRGKGEWKEPLIFQFWLATQRKRIEQRLASSGVTENDKGKLEAALKALGGFPSAEDAEQAVRAIMKDRRLSLWEYFGREYRGPLERAFEAAAK